MHLDFITFSIPYVKEFQTGLPKHDAFIFDERNPIKALPRYWKAWRLQCGGIYCIPDEKNSAQKRLIQMTGKDCNEARRMGLDDDLLFHLVEQEQGSMTRIDCAFDTNLETAKVQDFIDAFRSKVMKTKVRIMEVSQTIGRKGEPANTAYLGTRASDQQVVVYDKAKQMKLLHEAWVRVELRCYKNSAFRLAQDAREHGIDVVARQKIRNVVRSGVGWFEDMIAGQDVELTNRDDEPAFWKWLMVQVQPAIDARSEQYPDELGRLKQWLRARLAVANQLDKNVVWDKEEFDDLGEE